VLVHRRQLLDQWVERLSTFLGVPAKSIGRIGDGRNTPTGLLDVAVIQSLVKKGVVDDRVADYGHLIVDECHHLSAHSFEQVARQAKARFVLGLSATVARKDGRHPIIFMQCGPVRHRVNARVQAAARPFEHFALVQPTSFQPAQAPNADKRVEFQTLYQELVNDDARNLRICADVLESVNAGRSSRRGQNHPGDGQVRRRGIRRPASGHAVPDAAGLVARHDRPVRRPPAPAAR
jgi:superfamily II DNA or RNA helicase